MDFSTILQSDRVRALVQENTLERMFRDALFPNLLFRSEIPYEPWPEKVGDSMLFTAKGLIEPDVRPITPGQDPDDAEAPAEQWPAQLHTYGKSIPTHLPTSIAACADMFMSNTHTLGLHASQSLNRGVRNALCNTAVAGHTVADGAQGATTSLRVKRLNGFTRARATDGSKVRFDPVSATNPLPIRFYNTSPGEQTGNVVAFTPDTAGDELGPGVLTLESAITSGVADRAYVLSDDRTNLIRVGGGNSIDSLTPGTDIPTLADVRSAVGRLRDQNVPVHTTGKYHCHIDSLSQTKIFADTEFNTLISGVPDHYTYKEFALGEMLGCVFYYNNECPNANTVVGGDTATFDLRDPFAGELYVDGAVDVAKRVHRMIFSGRGSVIEYFQDHSDLLKVAGLEGNTKPMARIVNDGIEVFSERIQLIIRGPLNKFGDQIASSWKFVGDWPMRTDAATGDAARYKRVCAIEHSE